MKISPISRGLRRTTGMSLVEVLIAMVILTGILLMLFEVLAGSQKAWSRARDQLGQFQESRLAFETMNRRITDAVLQPYWGYEFPNDDTSRTPTRFARQSELHFLSGPASTGDAALIGADAWPSHAVFFHGPFGETREADWRGFNTLLNGWGYYVEHRNDEDDFPPNLRGRSIEGRWGFRLMEVRVSAEDLETYRAAAQPRLWYQGAIDDGSATVLAENVIALIVTPEAADGSLSDPTDIAPDYLYDTQGAPGASETSYAARRSRHQLPPLLRITMVVLSDVSAQRIADEYEGTSPTFGLEGLFQKAANYSADLAALEKSLTEDSIDFRTFTSTVRLRNARWSATLPET